MCGETLGIWGHPNIWGEYGCPLNETTCLLLKLDVGKSYLKLNSYTERAGKIIREPPDHTGNESTSDIPIGGSGQDKIANTCHL